jgi:hypothetical protein
LYDVFVLEIQRIDALLRAVLFGELELVFCDVD